MFWLMAVLAAVPFDTSLVQGGDDKAVRKSADMAGVDLGALAKTYNDKTAAPAERRAALKQIVLQHLRMGTSLEAVAKVFSLLNPLTADDIGIPHAFAGAWPFKPNPELDSATYVQIRFTYAEGDFDLLVFLIKGKKGPRLGWEESLFLVKKEKRPIPEWEESDKELISCFHGKCPTTIQKQSIGALDLLSVTPGNRLGDRVFTEEPDEPKAEPSSGERGKK
jgi:hypothetical protein